MHVHACAPGPVHACLCMGHPLRCPPLECYGRASDAWEESSPSMHPSLALQWRHRRRPASPCSLSQVVPASPPFPPSFVPGSTHSGPYEQQARALLANSTVSTNSSNTCQCTGNCSSLVGTQTGGPGGRGTTGGGQQRRMEVYGARRGGKLSLSPERCRCIRGTRGG